MPIDGYYDHENIFNRILQGQEPCVKIYEDENNLSFMDIFPESDGHCLVVPKYPARNLLDIPSDLLEKHILVVQRIAQAVKDALQPDGIRIMQYNGSVATQTIFHLHFHIVPCYRGVALSSHSTKAAPRESLENLAARIISCL